MSGIILPGAGWSSQPQVAVGLNPYWVARGLTSASYWGNLVTKTAGPVSAGGMTVATGTNTSGLGISTVANTLFCVANLSAVGVDAIAVGRLRYSGSANYGVGLRFNNTGLELDYGAGTSAWSYGLCAGVISTGRNSYAGSINVATGDSSIVLYLNGAAPSTPSTTGSSHGTTAVAWDAAIDIGKGTASGATAITGSIVGGIEIAATFASVLSAADIAALHRNPWKLFAPLQSRSIWVGITAASTGTVALTGNSATATAGVLSAPASLTLTSNSSSATQGALVPALSLAATGNSASATQGTLVPSLSIALTANSASATAGSLGLSGSLALSGNSASATQGALTPGLSLALSANSSTASAGSLTPSLTKALTGNSSTASQGALTPALSLALGGQSATATGGTLSLPGIITLSSNSATATQGAVTPGISVGLSGNSASATVGSLSPAIALALSGLSATSTAGIVIPGLTNGLTGNSATTTAGALGVPAGPITLALTGNTATATAGVLSGPSADHLYPLAGLFESYVLAGQSETYRLAGQSETYPLKG